MGKTNIEWTDATWNPVTGCTPISAGCRNCYAKRLAEGRLRGRCGYPRDNPFGVTLHQERLSDPLKWKKPRKVFVCSMGDLFHPDVPAEYVCDVFRMIEKCYKHQFMILTKRPQHMKKWLDRWLWRKLPCQKGQKGIGEIPKNLRLGCSASTQYMAKMSLRALTQIDAKNFISIEPMLEAIRLDRVTNGMNNDRYQDYLTGNYGKLGGNLVFNAPSNKIDWVICGGENATNARTMDPDWVRSLRDQCLDAGVPFFFKSWGEYMPFDFSYGKWCRWKNKKDPARYQIDGKQYREYPE